MNTFITVRQNVLWPIDKTGAGAGSIYNKNAPPKTASTVCTPLRYSQTGPRPKTAHLILFSPHTGLTQISKENVRLFCSGIVICLCKKLSFTSGGVSCGLCHTDLPSADSPLLPAQLSPIHFMPPPLSLFSLCFSQTPLLFPCISAAGFQPSASRSHSSACHRHKHFFTLSSVCVRTIRPQFRLGDKKRFLRKQSFYQGDC